jgi:serine/threonine protein kinase
VLRCAIRRGASELNHDDPSSFSPPAAFGPFRVLHQIGSGVLGPVFRTYEPERDRLIAVKAFRIDLLPEQSSALGAELQRIVDAGLTHPGIVQPVAAGMEGHLPYLAQEYIAAESLDIAMKHYAPASPARVMPFLRQIAGAIDSAAADGILHGSLHPRDVFLTTDEARATGFGIVQAIENIGFRAPTRRPYTAPERVSGDDWGTEADVYALGAIAHELLTGRRPAGPGDQDGSFAADVPAEGRARLRDVLARALAEDPPARFESAMAFVDALEAAAAGRRPEPAATSTAAPAVAAAAAPSLFDTDDAEADADAPAAPVETIDDVEDTTDVEDVDDIEDESDIEDTDDVEEPELEPEPEPEPEPEEPRTEPEEPVEPVEPVEPGEPDIWPPPGFATDDLDITSEKEADEAFGAFDLDLNRADPVVAAAGPTLLDETAAPEAAATFDYDTAVEEDEDEPPAPRGEAVSPAAAAPIPGPVAAPPVATPSVDAWRSSPSVAQDVPSGRMPAAVVIVAGLVAALLAGLVLGWAIWGRGGAEPRVDQAQQAGTGAPAAAADPPAATEVPMPAPIEPAPIPSTPATAAAPAAPASGRVLVRSTPSNAMVVIDGVWTGRTPLTKRDMAFGAHTVRVVLDGYEPINQRITLTPENASRELMFELQRARGRGPAAAAPPPTETAPPAGTPAPSANASLSISSRPAGARVLVDGRLVGVTPVKVAGLTAGAHEIRIELDGYRPWTSTVRAIAGEDVRVAAPLEPQR